MSDTIRTVPCLFFKAGAPVALALALAGAPTGPHTAHPPSLDETIPPVRDLHLRDTVETSAPPPSVVASGRKCDTNGNIYVVYADSPQSMLGKPHQSWDLPITRVAADSHEIVEYAVPQLTDYQSDYREAFNVDRWGHVYGLVTAFPTSTDPERGHYPDYLIVKFKDDGTVDSTVKLSNPSAGRLHPMSFDVFSDRAYVVTGILYGASNGDHTTSRPFTGIFDASGRLVQELTLANDVGPESSHNDSVEQQQPKGTPKPETKLAQPSATDSNQWPFEIGRGGMVTGPDGNVYLLRQSSPPRLYGISPGGEVVHNVALSVPSGGGLTLLELSFADESTLFVEFTHVGDSADAKTNPGLQTVVGLLSLKTGKLIAQYKLPAGVSNLLPGCPITQDEFSFLGTGKNGKLALFKFSPE